jgi:FdhD protein
MTPRRVPVHRVTGEGSRADNDHLAEESPLEILVEYSFKSQRRTWAWGVTLRSPGHDEELAAGLLFGEHRIHAASDILSQEPLSGGRHRISLHPDLDIDPAQPRSATAACGFCGSPHLPVISPLADSDFRIARRGLLELPARLAAQQTGFEQTGALHAAALFNARGEIELLREDIGRHNAVDKITGRALAEGRLPLAQCGLLLSGRAGYEPAFPSSPPSAPPRRLPPTPPAKPTSPSPAFCAPAAPICTRIHSACRNREPAAPSAPAAEMAPSS